MPGGLEVSRLDDGGYRIVGTPTTPWTEIITSVKPLAEMGLVEGDRVFLRLFGILGDSKSGIGAYVSFDAEGGGVLAADYGSGSAIAVPKGAHRMRCGISTPDESQLKPVDATVYPMLAKGDRAVSYYVPYVVGGGIPELWPSYSTQTMNGITIEPADGGYRVHGTATANANIWVKANLEAGAAYLASLSSTSPDVTAQVYRSGQTVTVRDGAPKRFEAVGGEYHLYVKVDAGRTVDAIARPSLIRIGDAGGGIANLVGPDDGLMISTTTVRESVEVTADGVRYVVTNGWSGCFFVYNVAAGTYRVDRGGAASVLASVRTDDSFTRNDYYSGKAGTDIYSSKTYGGEIALPEDGKIGFVLPQGEGVIHPSIVRVL